jgi:FkbM family methyltransferase
MDRVVNRYIAPLVENGEAIDRVIAMLADDESKTQFRRELVFERLYQLLKDQNDVVRYAGNIKPDEWSEKLRKAEELRKAGKIPALEYPPCADWVLPFMYAGTFVIEQYSHPAVTVPEGTAFLDCGASCGETAVWAAEKGAGTVWAFEPNPRALPYLKTNASKFGKNRINVVPLAVGAERRKCSIAEPDKGSSGSSMLVEDGNGPIEVVPLDAWVKENDVTPGFLKMDIQGYEIKAILGAQATLREFRPRIAIAIYHGIESYWTIPLLLKQIVPDYRFWCRKNSLFTKFILYGTV